MNNLAAPFPYFGGKRDVAELVWERFDNVPNYVEPFFGSGAVLLRRPHVPTIETVNDVDALLVNLWRAVQYNPESVARNCDWPVHELEIHAWHKKLVKLIPYVKARLEADPEWFHPVIAGRWVWGLSAWIGSGWCVDRELRSDGSPRQKMPFVAGSGNGPIERGVHSKRMRLPHLGAGTGGEDKHPCAHYGKGVHAQGMRGQLPHLAAGAGGGLARPDYGKGVHAQGMRISQQLPKLAGGSGHGDAPKFGDGVHSTATRATLYAVMEALSQRLRHVRVTCGDFERILSDAVTWRHGTTGVFLDPPYPGDGKSTSGLYTDANAERETFDRAFRYCIENGHDKRLRIAFCYYDGTEVESEALGQPAGKAHDVSHELRVLGWEIVEWRARGGYGGQSGNNTNASRERIAFSPGCTRAKQGTLF